MSKNLLFTVVLALSLSAFGGQPPEQQMPEKSEVKTSSAIDDGRSNLSCKYVFLIMNAMLRQHMLYDEFTSNIEKRAIDQYTKSIDPLKTYLLAADANDFQKNLKNMDKWLNSQNCAPIMEVQQIFKNRIAARRDFAKLYLGKDFKVDKTTKLDLDTEKKPFSKTKEELDEFQKKYIQFQVANFIASDMKLEEAKEHVQKRYERAYKRLEDQKEDEVLSTFLNSFATSLDPHSNYLSVDELEDFNIQMQLSLEGIGATLSNQDGYTVIEQLIAGGAAEASGQLLSQDKIISVAQGESNQFDSVIDLPLREVVQKIRGKSGTKVRLNVLRKTPDGTKAFKVTLQRRKINLEDEAAQISFVDKEVSGKKKTFGILNLPSFYHDSTKRDGRSCYRDVKKLLKEAQEKHVEGLVLDLSTNGGGSLEDAVKLAGLFFKTGNVVKTQGRASSTSEVLADNDPDVNYSGPLVILTSRLSASASEIVSGALKDYRRAVIVGADHTFGKGSVQTVLPLPKKLGAYKVTIGMFFVPGGKSTQHAGVDGDVVLPSPYSNDEIGEKNLDYSLPPKTISPFLSMDAFVDKGEQKWDKVDDNLVAVLKEGSKKRVTADADFKKIVDEIEKTKAKGKSVVLSEILDNKEKKADDEKKKKTKANAKLKLEEYLKRADIKEAVNVLGDMVTYRLSPNTVAKKDSLNTDTPH